MSASSSLSRAEAGTLLAAVLGIGAAGAAAGGLALVAAAAGAGATVAAAVGVAGVRATRRELSRTSETLDALAKGDFESRVVRIVEGGEVGRLQIAVNRFADRSDAFVREAAASLRAVSEQRYGRRVIERGLLGSFRQGAGTINTAVAAMAAKVDRFRDVESRFRSTLASIVDNVSAAAGNLQVTARSMATVAEETSEQSVAVAASVEQAAHNVQTVAAAAEELSASITEISQQVARSASTARMAVERVEATDEGVRRLADSAQEIGDVVELINDIAGKTNLLALNATIEAARAGEAGKGFAVVATEVKNLATQTAQATEVITRNIAAMQSATGEAVTAIRGIGGAVDEVNATLVAISAAVEEQSAATNEIARNVEQASAGTSEVTSRMLLVTGKANETGDASREVLTAAAELSTQSDRLETEMGVFVEALRKVV